MSVGKIVARLGEAGLALSGTLPISEYDAIVPQPWQSKLLAPGARGVLVVGNAGRTLWERFLESPEWELVRDPLDTYTRRVLGESALLPDPPATVGFYADRRHGAYLPLVALAQRAGFGSPGRVGVLIHPEYGPWIGVRAVLLLDEEVPFHEPAPYAPCDGCPAPCVGACHGDVIGASGVDSAACYQLRLRLPACAIACEARRACIVGPEHAYSAAQTAHHSRIRQPS